MPSHHNCSEEVWYLFEAIRNPRWMSLPLIGQDIYTFFHRTIICEVTRPARNVPLNSNK
jgi:hypothetical protein